MVRIRQRILQIRSGGRAGVYHEARESGVGKEVVARIDPHAFDAAGLAGH